MSNIQPVSKKTIKAIKKALENKPPLPFFTPTGKEGESKIHAINTAIAKIGSKIELIYAGDFSKDTGIKFPGNKEKINGIMPILFAINEVDFCNLTNYILNKLALEDTDNPSGVEKTVTKLQDKCKKLLNVIDSILINSDSINNNTVELKDIVKINEKITGILANPGDDFTISNIDELAILRANRTKYTKLNSKFKESLLVLRDFTQEIGSIIDDPDVLSLVPQLSQGNNFITDFTNKLDKTFTLENIPNEELRNILDKIKKLRAILSLIIGIQSAGDALAAAQSLTGLNIQKQLDKVQKSLDVGRIIPLIKKIVTFIDSINQVGQKLLKYIKLILIFVKLATVLVKVFKAIVKLFKRLPLPLKFLGFGKATRLNEVWVKALEKIDKQIDRLDQLSTLIKNVYTFCQNLTIKLQNINNQLQILQTNLQLCETTKDSPIIDEIIAARNKLVNTIEEINSFISDYNTATNTNLNTFGGFILQIQEEELVDQGVKYKRRRGVALDSAGIIVAQTDLTFATDTNIIIEELKLKLQNQGFIQSPGPTNSGFPDLDQLTADLTIDFDFIDQDTEEDDPESREIQNELDSVLDSINGLPKLRRRVREKVKKQLEVFKNEVQDGNTPENVSAPLSSTISNVSQGISTGAESTTANADILSTEQRTLLEKDLVRYKQLRNELVASRLGKPFGSLVIHSPTYKKYTDTIKQIEDKLDKDTKARLAGG